MNEAIPDGSWQLEPRVGGALAGRWWQWALSAPDELSPVRDETGEHAAWNQPDDLWFLAGTYGGKVVRTCAIPADRPVFFPVFNIQTVRGRIDQEPPRMPVARAEAWLNGVPLRLAQFSGQFGPDGGRRHTWGLWGALAPLRPGEYVLEIKADTGKGFWVDTVYHLTVPTS
ncbi:hypothetical protein [Streptomyces sp. N35]|uniref:hypothetical protein n=1 Tax=Streptomyces sp. N35 TaxID=2795730 RepID=UPI0027DB6AD6|nr:hypothetical protein [Streptomyces sp. N35]